MLVQEIGEPLQMLQQRWKKRARLAVFALPIAHVCLCAVAFTLGFGDWDLIGVLLVADWPISDVLIRWPGGAIPLFTIVGTAWWAILGWLMYMMVSAFLHVRAGKPGTPGSRL
jgi:hypothetical protein